MNPHLLDPWKPFQQIDWNGKIYKVFSRIVMEDDFVCRRRFMVAFPDGKERMLSLSVSKGAMADYEAEYGPGSHGEIVRQMVTDEVVKEIKAQAKPKFPVVTPHETLAKVDPPKSPLVYKATDFAKLESEMMAHLFTQGGIPSDIYGSPSLVKTHAGMMQIEKVFKDFALKYAATPINPAYFGKGSIVLDSPAGTGPQVTDKGLATLKKFGVVLAG